MLGIFWSNKIPIKPAQKEVQIQSRQELGLVTTKLDARYQYFHKNFSKSKSCLFIQKEDAQSDANPNLSIICCNYWINYTIPPSPNLFRERK